MIELDRAMVQACRLGGLVEQEDRLRQVPHPPTFNTHTHTHTHTIVVVWDRCLGDGQEQEMFQ